MVIDSGVTLRESPEQINVVFTSIPGCHLTDTIDYNAEKLIGIVNKRPAAI